MFVTAKYHKAAIHEKDEIIDGLMKRLSAMEAMEAKLAPFERRKRGERGRYIAG